MSKFPGTILFLSHDTSQTGAPIFLLRLLRWFRQNKNIKFRTLVGSAGDLFRDFESLGTVNSFEPKRTLYYRMLRRLQLDKGRVSAHLFHLREMLLQSDIRLVYANSIASARMVEFLSFLDCPVICHVHELNWAIQNLGSKNLAIFENRRAEYIAVSRAVRDNLVQRYGIQATDIHLIHGFVPVMEHGEMGSFQTGKSIHEMLGIPPESKLVCACGSIEPRKGTDLFLEIVGHVIGKYRAFPVHFVWVGGDTAKTNDMRKQTANSVLGGIVHFVGHTSDVSSYLAASDVFLLTSREDPFPLVMMEAALHQKPVICFDRAGGAPEFVEEDAGFVIPDFDVGKMGDKVVELLSTPELCNRMGMAGRQKVIDRHNLSDGANSIAAVIERVLSSGNSRQHVSEG